MKNKKNNKPTMKDVQVAIGNLIKENYHMGTFLRQLDSTLAAYIEYKDDAPDFKEWLNQELLKEEKKKNESNGQNSGESNGGDTETKIKSIKSGGKKEASPTEK
jgi:hypothetical protein